MVEIKFKRNHQNAILPTKAKPNDSGWDVYAVEDFSIHPADGVCRIETGLILAALTPGFELQARARSGNTAKKHVVISNSPGTIDNQYRGPVGILMNAHQSAHFKKGDKIAQLVPIAIPESQVAWVEEIEKTERGAGGFGSTGN